MYAVMHEWVMDEALSNPEECYIYMTTPRLLKLLPPQLLTPPHHEDMVTIFTKIYCIQCPR